MATWQVTLTRGYVMDQADVIASHKKRAELAGGVGALVLGAGLGLLLSDFLKPYKAALLLVGLLMHAWGMVDKHRLEKATSSIQLWWVGFFYWICWIALLVLVIYLGMGYFRG